MLGNPYQTRSGEGYKREGGILPQRKNKGFFREREERGKETNWKKTQGKVEETTEQTGGEGKSTGRST